MLMKKVVDVPIEYICSNPDQPRKKFDDEELLELSESIKLYGVLQPIIVKKDIKGIYILIAGERRYRAATLAGLKKIPAIIKEFDDKDSAIIALVENVQRQDLSFMEEAYAYKNLMTDFGLTQGEIALKVGKRQSTISNKIRLLGLPKEVRDVLVEEKLTERHARALLKIPEDDIRKQVLEKIVSHGLNVNQSEKLIEEVISKHQEEIRKKNKISYINYKIYVNSIRKVFGEIQNMEKGAKYFQEDKGDYFEVKILLPKENNKSMAI